LTTLVARPERVRSAGQRHQLIALAHARLMFLMLAFAMGIMVICGRLIYLGVFTTSGELAASATTLIPPRGDIVDRNGAPLAQTIDAWSIGVHPKKLLGNPDDIAAKLAELMPERTEAEYRRILRSGVNFTYLNRRAMPELVQAVNALGEPAIAFAREPERLYPQTTLAAHVLGYTDFDGKGVTGMERVLEERLTDPIQRATPVALSIDARAQAVMESELYNALTKHSAAAGTGVVLDVDTGEIVALASMPTYNPNRVGQAPPDARRNSATQSVYELGSAFKPITVAIAMDAGVVPSMSKRWDATAPLQVGRFKIRDDHAQNRWLNVPETLVHSSNIVAARIADEVGQKGMEAGFRKLGFDTAPDIELREKGRPLWPQYWARTTTMTVGFGHGIAITPLQLANAYATLVNGGVWRPTTLMKVEAGKAAKGRQVFTRATSLQIRQLLRLIVTDGTGRRADADGFRVGGKTGTAEKAMAGGYNKKVNVSTFAAVFPTDAPRYVVLVMLDSPKGTADTYGLTSAAWTSAPVVSRFIARAGPMLGVMPDTQLAAQPNPLASLLWKAKGEH